MKNNNDINNKIEKIEKLKNKEVVYEADFFVVNSHDFSMPKSIAVSSKKVGRGVTDVVRGEKRVYGYDGLEVLGTGLTVGSYKLLGRINHICKLRKNLVVSIDIDELMHYFGENNISNKSRFLEKLEIYSDEVETTIMKIRVGRSVYVRSLIVGYDIEPEKNLVTYYVADDFISSQKQDKYINNTNMAKYGELQSDIAFLMMQAFESGNFNKNGYNTIRYDDLRYSIPITSARPSNIKTTYKKCLDSLVESGFLAGYAFERVSNEEVVKYKLGAKCNYKNKESSVVAEQSSLIDAALEKTLNVVENQVLSLGINPEFTNPAVKTNWNDWTDDSGICDDELPF